MILINNQKKNKFFLEAYCAFECNQINRKMIKNF